MQRLCLCLCLCWCLCLCAWLLTRHVASAAVAATAAIERTKPTRRDNSGVYQAVALLLLLLLLLIP